MKIGSMRIDSLIDGELVLPGPTFYLGTDEADWLRFAELLEPVMGEPKPLMTLGGYLVRWDDHVVLVDAGIGSKPRFPFTGGGLRSALFALGVAREDVTDVIFTHLHPDHIGWATQDGKPFFPNATYRIDKRDWDHFLDPDYVVHPVNLELYYWETDGPEGRLTPITSQIEFFEAEQELLPGLTALDASGHTPGSVVIHLSSDGAEGLLLGDLIHSQPELLVEGAEERERWEFVGHTDRGDAWAALERFQTMIVERDIPFAGAHFPGLRWWRLYRDSDGALQLLAADTES